MKLSAEWQDDRLGSFGTMPQNRHIIWTRRLQAFFIIDNAFIDLFFPAIHFAWRSRINLVPEHRTKHARKGAA